MRLIDKALSGSRAAWFKGGGGLNILILDNLVVGRGRHSCKGAGFHLVLAEDVSDNFFQNPRELLSKLLSVTQVLLHSRLATSEADNRPIGTPLSGLFLR
jgi:hypothetical protein